MEKSTKELLKELEAALDEARRNLNAEDPSEDLEKIGEKIDDLKRSLCPPIRKELVEKVENIIKSYGDGIHFHSVDIYNELQKNGNGTIYEEVLGALRTLWAEKRMPAHRTLISIGNRTVDDVDHEDMVVWQYVLDK
jgi:hypothetical protein